jgi:hypothetical protein
MTGVILKCAECGCASRGRSKGWIGLIGDDPDGVDPPCICVFCPACGAEEFEYRPDDYEGYM